MYFLVGVADVEIFKGNELLIEGKTLIDNSITIGVTSEDVRAGKGAKLYGKYFHSATFDLKISDAMFRMEYLIANTGSNVELGGDIFVEETFIATDMVGTCTLKHTPVSFKDDGDVCVLFKRSSDILYKTIKIHEFFENNVFQLGETIIGEEYCVKYLYTNKLARRILIKSDFVPDILSVYLTSNLYEGDTSDLRKCKKAGTVTIKIPRFLLSGSQEIILNMTGHSANTIEGTALAYQGENCEEEAYYAEIIEIIDDMSFDDLIGIKIRVDEDEDELFIHSGTVDKKLKVYASFSDCNLILINNQDIKFIVDDESVLTIDQSGNIHPISNGVTTITAIYKDAFDSINVRILVYDYNNEDDYNFAVLVDDDTYLVVNDIDILVYTN